MGGEKAHTEPELVKKKSAHCVTYIHIIHI